MTEARTVDEAYSSACNTSNLSVKAEQRNDGDVLIACGMTPGLLGAALLRLHSEWDGTAKPRKLTETDARLLYGSLKTLPKVIDNNLRADGTGAENGSVVRQSSVNPNKPRAIRGRRLSGLIALGILPAS